MVSPIPSVKWKKTELQWLGIALAAHALFLLLPVGLGRDLARVPPKFTVELVQWRAAPEPQAKQPLSPPSLERASPVVTTEKNVELPRDVRTQSAAVPEDVAESETETESTEPEINANPAARATTATLLHSLERMQLPGSERAPSWRLGVHSQQDLPANWGRRAGNEELAARNPEMAVPFAPAEPVIVDRWLDTNGDHNVVVTLPSGDTLCGRAQAWNPMQPLVEHIMMFRTCGSGGKRTFEMASRPTPLWSTAE